MSSEIGIGLRLDAQTDGLKRAGQDFDNFAEKMSRALGVTDPEKVEQFWNEYNSGMEKAVQMADRLSLIENRGGGQGGQGGAGGSAGGGGGGGDGDNVVNFPGRGIFAAERTLTSAIRGGGQNAAGTMIGTAEGLLGKAMSGWAGMGVAAQAGLAGGAALVGGAAITNALSEQYEKEMAKVMSATAAIGRFGETAAEQSRLFRLTMSEMSETAKKTGHSFAVTAGLVETVSRGGGKNAMALTGDILSASRALGYDGPVSEFTDLATTASRFGQSDVLSLAMGGARNTVGSARTAEQAGAMLSMFEGALSEGIVKGFSELSGTQNWLYSVFGERAAGQGGAGVYSSLSGAARGATSLGSETDLMLFRAARGMGKPGESYIETMKRLEGGFSPELFDEWRQSISGASESEQVELTRQTWGVNYTTASQMLGAKSASEAARVYRGSTSNAMAQTAEARLGSAQEGIAQVLRDMGSLALNAKVGTLEVTDKVVSALLGSTPEELERKNEVAASRENVQELWGGKGDTEKLWRDRFGELSIAPAALRASQQTDATKALSAFLMDPNNREALAHMSDAQYSRVMASDNMDAMAWTAREQEQALGVLKEILAATRENKPAADSKIPAVIGTPGDSAWGLME